MSLEKICDKELEKYLADNYNPYPVFRFLCNDYEEIKSFLDRQRLSFKTRVFRIIKEKQLNEVEVYKRANLDKRIFSKIRNDPNYVPSRRTVIALGFGMRLNQEEMEQFLKSEGIVLSVNSKSDLIVLYFLHHKIYDIDELNSAMIDFGEKEY